MAVKNHVGSTKNTYYFYTDHLGSPLAIANNTGTVVQRQSFDAWGRRRDPESWTYTRNLPALRFDRGFTGHEHIEMFDLINMNARLYDPVLGRFLSPDPYVADGQSSQAYNRYTYANNNPLVYTDPTGEFVFSALLPGIGVFLDAMC